MNLPFVKTVSLKCQIILISLAIYQQQLHYQICLTGFQKMSNFNLEYQYQLFLQRMDLTEKEMPADQRKETKRTFMAALGIMLVICVEDLDAFKNPLTTEAVPYMFDQVNEFFQKEIQLEENQFNRKLTNKVN